MNDTTKRNEILNVAKELFLTEGYENTSIRKIVKLSKTSIGNFYFYFKSKEDLLNLLFFKGLDSFWNSIEKKLASLKDSNLQTAFVIFQTFYTVFTQKDEMMLLLSLSSSQDLKNSLFKDYLFNLKHTIIVDKSLLEGKDLDLLSSTIMGSLFSVIDLKMSGKTDKTPLELASYLTETTLKVLNDSPKEIAETIEKLKEMENMEV